MSNDSWLSDFLQHTALGRATAAANDLNEGKGCQTAPLENILAVAFAGPAGLAHCTPHSTHAATGHKATLAEQLRGNVDDYHTFSASEKRAVQVSAALPVLVPVTMRAIDCKHAIEEKTGGKASAGAIAQCVLQIGVSGEFPAQLQNLGTKNQAKRDLP